MPGRIDAIVAVVGVVNTNDVIVAVFAVVVPVKITAGWIVAALGPFASLIIC